LAFGVQLAGIDRLLNPADIHFRIGLGEDVVEAALRQAAIHRHLAAFEALDGNAGTRLLAFDTAAAKSCPCPNRYRARRAFWFLPSQAAGSSLSFMGLSPLARFGKLEQTALPAFFAFRSGRSGLVIVVDHATRWRTLRIMPRTAGVSSSVRLAAHLVEAKADSVARWSGPANRAADLFNGDGLGLCHRSFP
jgi:hypothetical protein